ncbi:MAG: hypothetical protein HXS52_14125 [Theionarchaea archaeon]|nr:hypothetical protein [Theionarchaea archaeon]
MKEKKVTLLVLAMLLSLALPAAFSEKSAFTVDYTFEPVKADGCQGCGFWTIEDTRVLNEPGAPLIPYRMGTILLPQGTELKDVKVRHTKPLVQSGFDLPWGQPPCTFSDNPMTVGKNEGIYGTDTPYPGKTLEIVGIQYCRGFALLYIHLFPVQYMPESGSVKFYPNLTVDIQFTTGKKNNLYRGLASDKAAVMDMVDNPEVVETYEDGPFPLASEEYIIITSDTMQSTFQTLATYKMGYVNGASVYTVSWIIANYSGVDNAEKIRNFIIDKYTNNGTKYVLLGGDISAVPYRGFYVSTGGYTDYDMLADMYFAHLDGSHNEDGDSYWGETHDSVDFAAEIAVGRAPCETVTEASNFVNKVIAHDQAEKPNKVLFHQSRVQSGNTPDSRCLAWNCAQWLPDYYDMEYLFEEVDGVTKQEWIDAWAAGPVSVVHIGHGNSEVYYINLEKDVGTVSWYGSDVAAMTNTFWPWTTSVACICGQIEYNDCLAEQYVKDPDNGAIAAIYNDNYGWFNTINACMYSGEFCEMEFRACWSDGEGRAGDMLNKARSYLASSAQTDSTYRWCHYERNIVGDPHIRVKNGTSESPPPEGSIQITTPTAGSEVSGLVTIKISSTGCVSLVTGLITYQGVQVLADEYDLLPINGPPFMYSWDTLERDNMGAFKYENGRYKISVNGYCPNYSSVVCSNSIEVILKNYSVWLISPSEGEIISGTITVDVDTLGMDMVEFYIDGTLRSTDTDAPFQFSWDTTHDSDGTHTVEVKGYCEGLFKDSFTVTVTVENYTDYYVTITNPSEGQTVSGTVNITTTTNCEEVRFYVDGTLVRVDTASPFDYTWDTTGYSDGTHTILAEGYIGGMFMAEDSVVCTVNNSGECLGTILVALLLLLGAAGTWRTR